MKIYFTATKSGLSGHGGKFEKNYRNIVTTLQEMGHDVDAEPLFEFPSDPLGKFFYEEHRKITKKIKESDVVIAEISKSSSGVGWELSIAFSEKKPILLLYREDIIEDVKQNRPTSTRFMEIHSYNKKGLTKILKTFLQRAKEKLDTKFILIISPEIDKYLEWASDYKRMHKAQIVRNAVEKEMENDEDYERYLKEPEK